MPNQIDPDSLGFLVNDIARLIRSAFERNVEASSSTVTAAEARVLAHMARCGGIRQNRLAANLGITPMSLTAFLDRLEKAGLVERGCDPDDRRANIVTLTPAADDVLQLIARVGRETRETALVGISAEDRDRFMSVALSIRANLEAEKADQASARCPAEAEA